MLQKIREFIAWVNEIRDQWEDDARLHKSALYWERAGALLPVAEAERERFLRFKIEEFRNFASLRYLEDPSLTRDDLKEEWLGTVLKPMAASPYSRDDAKALKAAIVALGDEMFVGDAARMRRKEIEDAVAEAQRVAAEHKKEMRRRAFKR